MNRTACESVVYPIRWTLAADPFWRVSFYTWYVRQGQHVADAVAGGRA